MQDDNDNWDDMFRALLKHGTNKKGTYDVLKSFRVPVACEDGASQVLHLGVWLHKQREEKLKGSLHADKEALLQVSSALLYCCLRNLALFCSILPCRHALLYFALPYNTLPYSAMQCLAMPCHALPCLALPCLALPCNTMLCPALLDTE